MDDPWGGTSADRAARTGVPSMLVPLLALLLDGADSIALPTGPRPITDGSVTDAHPDVVALLSDHGNVCSATVVGARTVLTAAHCVARRDLDPSVDRVAVGPLAHGYYTVGIVRAELHPDFDDDSLAADLAVLTLERPVDVPPAVLAGTPLTAHDIGGELRIVGFGWPGPGAHEAMTKREGITRIERIDETTFDIVPGPSQTCAGDSGGPALLEADGGRVLVGVTSSGDWDCAEFGREMRIDAYRDDFLDAAIDHSEHGEPHGCTIAEPRSPITALSMLPWLLAALAVRRRAA